MAWAPNSTHLPRIKTMVPTLKGRLEWNSRTIEATSGIEGCTESLLGAVLDSEVEECIGGRETSSGTNERLNRDS